MNRFFTLSAFVIVIVGIFFASRKVAHGDTRCEPLKAEHLLELRGGYSSAGHCALGGRCRILGFFPAPGDDPCGKIRGDFPGWFCKYPWKICGFQVLASDFNDVCVQTTGPGCKIQESIFDCYESIDWLCATQIGFLPDNTWVWQCNCIPDPQGSFIGGRVLICKQKPGAGD